jgi:hypothetical protein
MPTNFAGVPSVRSGPSITPRNIFVSQTSANPPRYAPSLILIDGTYSRDTGESPTSLLRAGTLLGKITSSGKYRPSIIGTLAAAYTSGGTSLTVSAAVATEVARLIALAGTSISLKAIGPPTAAGTNAVTSVTCSAASGTTLTVTSLGVDKAAGTLIAPADGSQAPLTVLDSTIFGIDVTDASGAALDQPLSRFLIGADLIAAQIPFLTTDGTVATDASVQTYLKTYLKAGGSNNTAGSVFTFDNDR